jgi:hypothetical protein
MAAPTIRWSEAKPIRSPSSERDHVAERDRRAAGGPPVVAVASKTLCGGPSKSAVSVFGL